MALAEVAELLDERALFFGQWGLRGSRGGDGPAYEELVETEGRPRLRAWLDRMAAEGLFQPAVVYGYYPAVGEGQDLVLLGARRRRRWGRRRRPPRSPGSPSRASAATVVCAWPTSCDPREQGVVDVLGLQVATAGRRVSEAAGELFARDAYREYLELHGLSVQLTEALAERMHRRVREELGIADEDAAEAAKVVAGGYRGARYSWGYPACPDLEQQAQVDRLLDFASIDVSLSEEFQLEPEQSTCALVLHHPEAVYFNAG